MKKASKVTIKAVASRPAEAAAKGPSPSPELVETHLWPMSSAPAPPRLPRSPPTATRNRYDDLTDSDDAESEAVKALAQLISHVQLKSDQSQGRRKSKRDNGEIATAHIKSVAEQVLNGKIRLPDLSLDTSSEYDCYWALVDSGADVNCATRKQFPNSTSCDVPLITLTNADGKKMKNQGAMKMLTKSKEEEIW